MERPTFEYTRPRDGKVFKWRPLSMGVSMDIEAQCQGDQAWRAKYEGAVRRIVAEAGKAAYSETEWRDDWEEDDALAFMRHYMHVEAGRAATFAKPGGKGLDALEAAVAKVKSVHREYEQALDQALAAARVASPLAAT